MVSDTGDIRVYLHVEPSGKSEYEHSEWVNGQPLTMRPKVTPGWKGRSMRTQSDKVINALAGWSCMT